MILKLKQFLKRNKGITLVEIIITISIMGILTTTLLPNFTFFKKYQDKLELEKELIVIEDTVKQKMMERIDYNVTYRYPLRGTSNSEKVGFCNITNKLFFEYSSYLLNSTNLYNVTKEYESYSCEITSPYSYYFNADLTINMKDGKKFIFKYEVYDNQYSYRDYGYLKELVFYYNDVNYEIIYF